MPSRARAPTRWPTSRRSCSCPARQAHWPRTPPAARRQGPGARCPCLTRRRRSRTGWCYTRRHQPTRTAALSAAAAAGLQPSQVTTSFATAWDDTLSGSYLLFAVGQAAINALEYNTCGWDNPSTDIQGSTPFDYVTRPLNVLIPAGLFMNAAAAAASLTPQRATDLAYYAVYGTLPPGVTTVPAAATPARACSGSPS